MIKRRLLVSKISPPKRVKSYFSFIIIGRRKIAILGKSRGMAKVITLNIGIMYAINATTSKPNKRNDCDIFTSFFASSGSFVTADCTVSPIKKKLPTDAKIPKILPKRTV